MDKNPMSLGKNPAGAMRDPYHLTDREGAIFGEVFAESGLGGVNVHRLIYKKYRSDELKADPTRAKDIEFRDAVRPAICYLNPRFMAFLLTQLITDGLSSGCSMRPASLPYLSTATVRLIRNASSRRYRS